MDLDAMNGAGRLADGSVPLMLWLANAAALAGSRPEVAVFHAMLASCTETLAALGCRPAWSGVNMHAPTARAVARTREALGSLQETAATPAREREELQLLCEFGEMLLEQHGFADPELYETYMRASRLCTRVKAGHFTLGRLTFFFLMRGDIRKGEEMAELIEWSDRGQDAPIVVEAHHVHGVVDFHAGRFHAALGHLTRAVQLYFENEARPHPYPSGFDPGISSLSYLALCSCYRLRFMDAQAALQRIAGLALRVRHPFSHSAERDG